MISPTKQLYCWLAPVIILGTAALVVAEPLSTTGQHNYIWIGYILGTMFGHATLASAWSALGPSSLIMRMPLSLVWLSAVYVALMANEALNSDSGLFLTAPLSLLGQWLLVQVPIWVLVWRYGVQLRHRTEVATSAVSRTAQFGIRQLMIFTAIVGVALGIGRLVVPPLIVFLNLHQGALFPFLTVAAVVMLLPLVLAVLLEPYAISASLVAIVLIAGVTGLERPLLKAVGLPPLDFMTIVWTNAFSVFWVLMIGGLTRFLGYRLGVTTTRRFGTSNQLQAMPSPL